MKSVFGSALIALSAGLLSPTPLAAQHNAAPATSNLVSIEDAQADLDALYTAMQESSVDLYAYRSKADFDAFYLGLRAGITQPLSRFDAAILFQRLAAFAKIGHIRSNAFLPEIFAEFGAGETFAPIFIRVERDGTAILTDTANADGTAPAGARLIAIDGEPIERILKPIRDLVSAERPYMADTVLEDFFPIFLEYKQGDKTVFEVELEHDGDPLHATVPAVDFATYQAMGGDNPVPSLATNFNTREFRMIDAATGYLRPGPFSALEGEEPVNGRNEAAMLEFIDESFAQLLNAGANDLIIDLRNNSGGDVSFSDPMIAWFANRPFRFAKSFTLKASPQVKAHYAKVAAPDKEVGPILARLAQAEAAQPNGALYPFAFADVPPREGDQFKGRVWVLVNRKSYSNATSVAAMIKDYGFGTIMGEETSDVPTSFASIFPYTLPNTGMSVDLAKSYFIRPSGDERVRGVIPDIELPRQPVGSSEDVMLNAALEAIGKR